VIFAAVGIHGLNRYETARKLERRRMPDIDDIIRDEADDV
jgi:hypothetical protein